MTPLYKIQPEHNTWWPWSMASYYLLNRVPIPSKASLTWPTYLVLPSCTFCSSQSEFPVCLPLQNFPPAHPAQVVPSAWYIHVLVFICPKTSCSNATAARRGPWTSLKSLSIYSYSTDLPFWYSRYILLNSWTVLSSLKIDFMCHPNL